MNNLLLTSDKVDLDKFNEKYPTNILNLKRDDIFNITNIDDSSNIQSYNQSNIYEIYDSENYNESLDKYQKLREKTIEVVNNINNTLKNQLRLWLYEFK